jgi:hypothetical protein
VVHERLQETSGTDHNFGPVEAVFSLLSQTDAWSPTILCDELNSGLLQGLLHRVDSGT